MIPDRHIKKLHFRGTMAEPVTLVELTDGTVIGISDDLLVWYPSLKEFDDGHVGDVFFER